MSVRDVPLIYTFPPVKLEKVELSVEDCIVTLPKTPVQFNVSAPDVIFVIEIVFITGLYIVDDVTPAVLYDADVPPPPE